MKALSTLLFVAGLVSVSACGGSNSTSTTQPSVTVGPQTELFEGTLDPRGSKFYSFQVQQTGNVSVMLASVTASALPGTSSTVVLGLSLGVPSGTDCTIQNDIAATAGLTSQLVVNMAPGLYCARVYDIGNLKSTVDFAARIIHT